MALARRAYHMIRRDIGHIECEGRLRVSCRGVAARSLRFTAHVLRASLSSADSDISPSPFSPQLRSSHPSRRRSAPPQYWHETMSPLPRAFGAVASTPSAVRATRGTTAVGPFGMAIPIPIAPSAHHDAH